MGVLGLHLPPVAGIAVAAGCDLPKDCPPVSHRALISLTCQISVCGTQHGKLLTVRDRPHTQDTFFSRECDSTGSITSPHDHLLLHAVRGQCDELRML